MKKGIVEERVTIPEGVTVSIAEGRLVVNGPKGELSRNIVSRRFTFKVESGDIIISTEQMTKREKKQLFTIIAHIKNLCKGVTEGFTYKLKICSGHFPMNVSIKGDTFEIKNFIGEAVPRTLIIKPGSEVKMEGDFITVTGIDKEIVAQTAASIETLTRRPGFDSRIFQDGIYLIEKDGKILG